MAWRTLLAAGLLLASMVLAQAATPIVADPKAALARSRQAEGRLVGDYDFVDADGHAVKMADFRGKPLVISIIYTSCDHTCPTTTQNLARAVAAARRAVGGDRFSVISVGFDSVHDTPAMLAGFARQQDVHFANWRFLSADADTIARLTDSVGFTFYTSSRGFDHIDQMTLVDSDGRIYRQVYGENFDLPLLVEPIKELVLGQRSSLTSVNAISDRVRFICTVYDPATDSYRVDYSFFIEIGMGFVAIISLGYFLFSAWRSSRASTN